MSNHGEPRQFPSEHPGAVGTRVPRVPLHNLATLRSRMDSLQQFLSESVNSKTLLGRDQMAMVTAEISDAIHQIILNGAALLSCSQPLDHLPAAAKIPELPSDPPDSLKIFKNAPLTPKVELAVKSEETDEAADGDCDIVELDAVELLAEHVHFCEICGKGFKRDANLRMHMRAHGNQFKTPEALAKPLPECHESSAAAAEASRKRFSCPYDGCNRNRKHKKFRPLKSVICVRNHFKRSHCPKMYSCNRCNKKSFSVVADLKSHLKHCGESRWKCSCGTSFSRKDKLFGHIALFEGHMPAVVGGGTEEEEKAVKGVEEEAEVEEEEGVVKEEGLGGQFTDNAFFEGLLDGFGSIEGYSLQEILDSPSNSWSVMEF